VRNALSTFIRKPSGTNHLGDVGAGGRAMSGLLLKKENGIFTEQFVTFI
jgi:hypothetical protein